MAIITNRFNKKLARKKRLSEWWFTITKLRFIRKVLRKLVIQLQLMQNLDTIEKINVFPSDFKKLSNEQIERGLNLFVKRNELTSWSHCTLQNEDGYLVVFPVQNPSQTRFSSHIPVQLRQPPEEIQINNITVEPLPGNAEEIRPESPKEEDPQQTIPEPEQDEKPTSKTGIW